MAYYDTCPNCGSNLDPGEKCECAKYQQREPPGRKELPYDRTHETAKAS